jgi:predicted phosphodiesterase
MFALKWPSWARYPGIYILMLAAGLLFIQLFARTVLNFDSFSFDIKMNLAAEGGTRLAIPPVGNLFFKTHRAPWEITVTLDQIDFTRLESQLNHLPPKQQWLALLQDQLILTIARLFSLVFFWGICGGTLLLIIFRIYPNSRWFWYGTGLTLLLILGLIGGTVFSYDQSAVERPQYQGVLASAPWAMNLISMGMDHVEVIGNNLKQISQGLPMLYKQAGHIGSLGNVRTDLVMLHVSDIHNNPAALDFIRELIVNFKVQAVIDTGDLTDYGTAPEAEIINNIKELKLPYLFIPGNHDSPLIIENLKKLRNVTVLTGGPIQFSGLTIDGVADPASADYNSDVASPQVMAGIRDTFSQRIFEAESVPDIIAVHNRIMAENLIGSVPLILHGHDHKYILTTKGRTIIDDAGTTGAAGLRGITKKGVPYSASILYWQKNAAGKLVLQAIDSISIDGTKGKFSLERHAYNTEASPDKNQPAREKPVTGDSRREAEGRRRKIGERHKTE